MVARELDNLVLDVAEGMRFAWAMEEKPAVADRGQDMEYLEGHILRWRNFLGKVDVVGLEC